jgi:hypothetical protein
MRGDDIYPPDRHRDICILLKNVISSQWLNGSKSANQLSRYMRNDDSGVDCALYLYAMATTNDGQCTYVSQPYYDTDIAYRTTCDAVLNNSTLTTASPTRDTSTAKVTTVYSRAIVAQCSTALFTPIELFLKSHCDYSTSGINVTVYW